MHATLFLFLSSEDGWLPSLSFFTLSLASIELTPELSRADAKDTKWTKAKASGSDSGDMLESRETARLQHYYFCECG